MTTVQPALPADFPEPEPSDYETWAATVRPAFVEVALMRPVTTCTADDCARPAKGRGMCDMHYRRWKKKLKRDGFPLPPAPPRPKWSANITGDRPYDQQYRERTKRRIAAHSKADPASGCWLWQKALDRDGYGVCQALRRDSAHRVAYLAFVGPIPDGLVLDHRCHSEDQTCHGGVNCLHRRCVNPNHLEPVTGSQNTLRGRSIWAANSRKTHCKRGHEFTRENTITRTDGRVCRACARAATAKYMQKKRESEMARRQSPAERLAAMRRDLTLAELAKQSVWDMHVVEQAIFLYGQGHDQWSCNDIRPFLPEMGRGFVGVAINSLRMAGVIARVPVDGLPSTLESTHGHRLAVWMLTAKGHRIAAQRFHHTADAA